MDVKEICIQAETRYKELMELQEWNVKMCNNQPLLWPGSSKAILHALCVNSWVITLMILNFLHFD